MMSQGTQHTRVGPWAKVVHWAKRTTKLMQSKPVFCGTNGCEIIFGAGR